MNFLKYFCAASLLAASAGTLWSCDDDDDKRLSDAVLASVSSLTFEAQDTSEKIITVYADAEAFAALGGHYPADLLEHVSEEHFGTEFLDYKLAVRTVASPEEALAHIARYSSRHSEAIVTENKQTATQFTRAVDAACVYVNVSTAFTDGGQFGFGAEVGISTQKLHARGPMGLPELTTYKYVVTGDGQIRES